MTTKTPRSFVVRAARGFVAVLDGLRRLLLNLLLLALIGAAALWAWQRLRTPALHDKTTLVLELSGSIVDQARGGGARSQALDRLRGQGGESHLRLRDVLAGLDAAARDPQVTQLLLLTDGLQGTGLVTLREVAASLERFKATGKKVVAWGSGYDQRQYYLAAHANEVWLHPMGMVLVEGYGRWRSYYKEAFDRLGVSANVVRAGRYKNAAETFTASGPSAETVESDRALYGSLWASWQAGVERARKLPAGSTMAVIDSLPGALQAVGGDTAKFALNSKQVDALKTRDEMRAALIERGAADEKNKTFRQVSFGEFLARHVPAPEGNEIVGVVVAQGEIVDGRTGPGLIGGLSTAELIRRAREAEDVKALVLRVNSPGGSAFGSELVRRELELTRAAGKPVVVSMGDVAASGGYWISLAADEVIADEATITGSIGVVGMLPSAEEALGKVGIRGAGTTTTWLAGAMDVKRTPEPRLVALVQTVIDSLYTDFIGRVATARKLSPDKVEAVAQGRVWSGKDALPLSLVDRLGSFDDAVAAAARRAKLAEGRVPRLRWIEVEPGRLQKWLQRLGLSLEGAARWAAVADSAVAPEAALAAAAPLMGPALAASLTGDLGWLAEVATGQRPFVAATHCLCAAP
ncbi:MAG: signal peptide peptidase SppA [Rubrivivax sp.]|nr:signal peptide peptidase SppA [Rubrivivax sp.]